MPVRLLLFGRLQPDLSRFDTEGLRQAENVLPIHGSYRPLPKLVSQGSLSVSGAPQLGAVVSALAHVYQPSAPIQRMQPDERTGSTSWVLDARDDVETDADETQQQAEAKLIGTEGFDDGSFIVSPGKPTAQLWEATLNVVQAAPATASSHFLFLRYKIFDPSDAAAWTVKLRLKAAAGTIATLTTTGTGEQDWTTAIATLSAGEMANLVAADFTTEDQATLEVEATLAGSLQVIDPDADIRIGDWTDESADVEDLYAVLVDANDATYVESGNLIPAATDQLRLGLADGVEPAAFTNLAMIIKWVATNNGVFTDLRVYSGGLLLAEATELVPPATLTAETKTLTLEPDFLFEDVDWTDLVVEVVPTYRIDRATLVWAANLPDADVDTGDWVTAPLFSKIKDSSDATFITTPSMAVNTDKPFTIDLEDEPDVTADSTRERKIVMRARNNDGSNAHSLKVEILENGVAVYAEAVSFPAGGTWVEKTFHISQIRHPASGILAPGFTADSGTIFTDLGDWVNEITSDGNLDDKFQMKFPTLIDPNQNAGWLMRLTAYIASGGTTCDLNVSLYDGATLLETQTNAITIDDAEDTYVVLFSETAVSNFSDLTDVRIEVAVNDAGPVVKVANMALETPNPYPEVTDYDTMRVRVTAVGDSVVSWTMDISEIDLQRAAQRKIRISELDLQTDSVNYVGVSWAQLQVPEASSGSYAGKVDETAIIAARMQRIYRVNPQDTGGTVFTDISDGSPTDYTASPYPWSMTSWGALVLGTNYVDAVWKYDPDTDTQTDVLITSTDKPKARFIITMKDQVTLAFVSFSGSTAGQSYEFWTSDVDDAASFDESDSTNGSKRFFLRQTPGAITAAQGGEFGLFWKRTSLLRASWLGSPLWWRVDVISRSVGTTQPDSIVYHEGVFYFWGSDGGFYQTTGHENPRRIDDGLVRFFTEPLAGRGRVKRTSSFTPFSLERRMFGAYDRGSKCIVWWYLANVDLDHRVRRGAIYNLIERRFSTFVIDTTSTRGACEMVQLPNVEHDANFLMYGLGVFEYDSVNDKVHYAQLYDRNHYTSKFLTPVYPVNPSEDTVGYVNQARPVIVRGDGHFTAPWETSPRPGTRSRQRPNLLASNNVSLELRFWEGQELQATAKTVTLTPKDANEDGWMECAIKGRFVQAELTIKNLESSRPIYETVGIQIKVEEGER